MRIYEVRGNAPVIEHEFRRPYRLQTACGQDILWCDPQGNGDAARCDGFHGDTGRDDVVVCTKCVEGRAN